MATNKALENFPKSFAEFNADRPITIIPYEWLTHPTNEYKLPTRAYKIIRKIDSLAKKHGHSYAHIDTIAFYLRIHTRTLQKYLRKLVAIEILEEMIKGNDRYYKVNWHLLRDNNNKNILSKIAYSENMATPKATPASFANTVNRIIYPENGYTPVTVLNHHGISNITTVKLVEVKTLINNLPLSDPISTQPIREIKQEKEKEKDFTVKVDITNNLNDLIQLDPIEEEIKKEFETTTNIKLNLKRDSKALKQLKELFTQAKNTVLEAFRNVADHLSKTGGKIYSLSYILTTAKNLLHAKSSPKKEHLSDEDKRNLYVGGKPPDSYQQAQAPTPEQLAQQKKETDTFFKNEALRQHFFNSLPESEQEILINQKILHLKSDPNSIWLRIKNLWSVIQRKELIELVKSDLLESYLLHQQFLADSS